MATKKFSELTTTSTPSSSALFAITDSDTSVAVTLANVAANMPDLTATTVTSSGALSVSGNATFTGDVTISGDDLFMSTNTSGAALIADGTNFNPVVISGDIAIATNGAVTIQNDAVEAGMLNDNVISGQTELSSGVADADELLISDAGTLKRVGLDTAKSYFASTPTAITVADESSDTSCFPLFVTAATGDLGPKTASGLTFNSSTDVLSGTFSGNITGNVTGNVSGTSGSTTGNAATATALQTARNIGGVSFDGTANIDLPGVNSAGNQNTSGTAATATTSTNVTVADESSDTTCFPLFVTAATGDLAPKSGSNLAFNSSSGVLTATGFAGDLTGDVTGNTSGSSGSCTGNSATATTSTNVTVADESSDTTCFPLFVTAATGDLAPKSGSNLAFNSSSGVLTATGFAGNITGNVTGNTSGSSGSCTGNSATATALETARNIGGVSFDGTGNIDLPGVNSAGNQNTSGTAAGLSATLAVGSGGTGATSLTANGVLIGNGTSAITAIDLSTKGSILVGDGSGNPQTLAVGSNDQVLTADSSTATGLKFATPGGGGGLAVISAVNEYNASGNTTSYSFTGFDSTYDNYYVIVHALSQSGQGDIQMRFLDDGSALTNSDYRQTTLGLTHNNSEKRITTDAADKITLIQQTNSGDKDPMNGWLYFNNGAGGRWDSDANDSKGQVSPSVVYMLGGEGSNGSSRIAIGHGYLNDTQANICNGFQLLFAGGSGAHKINLTIYGVNRA
tara:strand:+ start:1530 stop:3752 length:2223 start_codon:yes stop_codon:yes gene_type:complete